MLPISLFEYLINRHWIKLLFQLFTIYFLSLHWLWISLKFSFTVDIKNTSNFSQYFLKRYFTYLNNPFRYIQVWKKNVDTD